MIGKIREMSALLDEVAVKARAAHAAATEVAGAAPALDEHHGRLRSILELSREAGASLASLSSSSAAASDRVRLEMDAAAAASSAAAAAVTRSAAAIEGRAAEVGRRVPQILSEVERAAELAQGQITTRLDDLQHAVADHSNLWNKAVSELIDAVKIGAVPIQELISLYGDAQIGGQRLSEYLNGLDFNYYRDQVRGLIQGLHEGSVEIARVQEYLGQTQLLFAKQLSDVIELFRKGEVTLKRVQEIVRQVQRAFPDSELSDLAQALYDALKKGGV